MEKSVEKSEILVELASSLAQIVEKRVNANKPTIDNSVAMVIDCLQMGEHSDGITQETFNEIIKVARQNGFEIGDENEYETAEYETVIDRAIELINDNEVSEDSCEGIIDAIKNSKSSFAFSNAAIDWVYDNGFVKKADIDEDWAFDNLDDDLLRSIAKRYIEEKL